MPRPTRRTRVASTRTTTKAGSSTTTAPVPASLHTAPSEGQQPADEASSDIYDVSDREKEKAKQKRESMRDAPRATSRSRPVSKQQAKVLETARQRRDFAMERLENMTSTSSNQASELVEQQSDHSIELGRKVAGTPQPKRIADVSGLDLDDDMFDDLSNTTFDIAGPASAQRSADTSSFSASQFKRRPRAGSFLSREDGYIRPSSRAGPTTPGLSSNFNIGVFKKRAREPSILGTAQKPRPQRAEPEPELESDPEDEDDEVAEGEDGFAPEAESTPLKRSKRRSEEIEVDRTPPALASANPRKRKSSEGHEQRSRSSPFEDNGLGAVVPQTQTDSDLSSPPSTPPGRAQSSRPATPIMDEELLAPPLSSSPSAENEEIWPPLQSLARGRSRRPASALRRTPVPNDSVSDMSSPPSLTYSPNYREPSPPLKRSKRRPASKQQEAKKLTTADLAGLLPRRRRRNAGGVEEDSDAEVDLSGLMDDDDELSHLDVRARRHPARPASRGAGNSRNQNTARGRPASRGKGKQQPVPSSANRRATITYGRTSDKENQGEEEEDGDGADEGDDDDGHGEESSQDMLARVGEELKNAARKFQEVDKWQLDYEEMTQSSSPRDAR
ncbi:hypothetical protein Hte_002899 [Hypoxylon texense]